MNTMLLKVLFCAFFLLSACGGSEEQINQPPPPPKKVENCRTYVRPSKDSITLKVWLDKSQYLKESRVISALNSYWSEVGLHVVKADSPKTADFGLLYMSSGCRVSFEVGRLQHNEWADLDSIMVDYTCFDKIPGYLEKFSSAVSHALGRLMGIEGYPSFCSEGGIMSFPVGQMAVENPPIKLSAGDKNEFYKRTHFFKQTVYETVCKPEVAWESGSYSPSGYEQYTFWADESLSLPVGEYLNKYFGLFGRSFVQVKNPDLANFALYDWGEEYNDCSPTAIAYMEDKDVFLKFGKCVGAGNSLKDATVVVHEVSHLFGMRHIPEWCGNSIMNAQVNPGPSFTPTDVKAWVHRDANPLEAKILKVEKDKLRLTFVPLNLVRR